MTNLSSECVTFLATAIQNVSLSEIEKIVNNVASEYGEQIRENLIATLISNVHTKV